HRSNLPWIGAVSTASRRPGLGLMQPISPETTPATLAAHRQCGLHRDAGGLRFPPDPRHRGFRHGRPQFVPEGDEICRNPRVDPIEDFAVRRSLLILILLFLVSGV